MAPGVGQLMNQCMYSLLSAKQSYSSHQPLAFYFEIFINLSYFTGKWVWRISSNIFFIFLTWSFIYLIKLNWFKTYLQQFIYFFKSKLCISHSTIKHTVWRPGLQNKQKMFIEELRKIFIKLKYIAFFRNVLIA